MLQGERPPFQGTPEPGPPAPDQGKKYFSCIIARPDSSFVLSQYHLPKRQIVHRDYRHIRGQRQEPYQGPGLSLCFRQTEQ